MGKKALIGTFDAERFWRPAHTSKLPELRDESASRIVACMDELLFPLCEPGDRLLTRYPMNQTLKDYLRSIGFSFDSNILNLQDLEGDSDIPGEACLFELLYHKSEKCVRALLDNAETIEPYAVLPWTEKIIRKYRMPNSIPKSEDVIRVNSKLYSFELHERIGLKSYGEVVKNAQEMAVSAERVGGYSGAFLIKDAYGVSGKGNTLITSAGVFNRVIKHVIAQEEKGLATCFLIEPLLNKKTDFSCQIHIDHQGSERFLSIQTIYNSGFSYLGSMTADDDFVSFLENKGYFGIVEKVAAELYQDGYFGDVCIDSMLLKNDEIVPLVEINARKSMGLINHYIDQYLARLHLKGHFVFLSVGIKGTVCMDDLLKRFDDEGILFTPEKHAGIIPLSSNTLLINRDMDQSINPDKLYKGRLYLSVVAKHMEERRRLIEKTKEILKTLSICIYN